MAEQPNQMRPSSPQDAPDPSNSYERSHPEAEAGMGRLDTNSNATPSNQPDGVSDAVGNAQNPERQINAHEVTSAGAANDPNNPDRDLPIPGNGPAAVQPDHSMKDEEPDGWDQAPNDIKNPQERRHPKTEGKGGTA